MEVRLKGMRIQKRASLCTWIVVGSHRHGVMAGNTKGTDEKRAVGYEIGQGS